jgi:hypothetical protein
MKLLAPLVLAAVLPTAGLAQECAAGFAALDKQIKGAALQAQYKGKEDSHPMVLHMADGSLVDLTGQILTDQPYPGWASDEATIEKVKALIKQSEPLIKEKKEEECTALLQQAQVATSPEEAASAAATGDPAGMTQPGGAVGTAQPPATPGASNPQ